MAVSPPRIAILGGGPIGLEAALYAAALRLPFTLYERGRPGEHLRRWGHVRLFSPFGQNTTPLGVTRLRQVGRELPADTDLLTGREHVAAYLEPLAALPELREPLRTETTALAVGRRAAQGFRLLLRTPKGELAEDADIVLDCTGVYGQPRFLGEGGIAAVGEAAARPHLAWGPEDVLGERRNHYADRTTLVIGGGFSAATTVCALATLAEKHQGTWVIWLVRQTRSQPLKRIVNDPLRERDLLAVRANSLATRGDGNVEYHDRTVVEAVQAAGPDGPFVVSGSKAGHAVRWEVDRVVANVGYSPDIDLFRELHTSLRPGTLEAPPQQPERNFFILGAKSHGRNSTFLLRNGFEQVRDVFALLTGKADLDLYARR
jgi:thioredoxin reductase